MYYIIDNNKNVLIAASRNALVDYGCEIKTLPADYDAEKYIVVDDNLIIDPDYEEKQKQKERERLNQLNLTKADFWIALLDRNITKAMVKAKIELIPDETLKAKTLIRLDEADHFWRGDPSMDIIGAMFGITPADLDYLFENKALPVVDEKEPTEEAEE